MRTINHAVCRLSCVAALMGGAALAHEGDHEFAPPGDALAVTHVVRTGAGEHTYESIPNWNKLPEGRKVLGPTHGGIAED